MTNKELVNAYEKLGLIKSEIQRDSKGRPCYLLTPKGLYFAEIRELQKQIDNL